MAGVVMPPREAGTIVTYDWAQSWMPQTGALTKDEVLHMRWKCTYPKPTAPYWVTKAWGGKAKLSQTEPKTSFGTCFASRMGMAYNHYGHKFRFEFSETW